MGIIEFENVRYTYDGRVWALDGMDLAIQPGEFVCILGGNGSGKSTLAKHVNALLAPDEGAVRVLDASTADPDQVFFIRSNAGMVFQNPDDQLVASIIEDDVAFGPENLGLPSEQIRERVTRALAQVGLQGFEKRETAALSGGQKQRVAIAGVLAMDPQILILDDAGAMLDPRGRSGLMRVCRELHEAGLTILMVTHYMEEAAQAERVIVLSEGRIALEGTPDEVLSRIDVLEPLSLDVPFAVKLAYELDHKEVAIPVSVSEEALVNSLTALLPAAAGGNVEPAGKNAEAVQAACAERSSSDTASSPLIAFENVSFTYSGGSAEKERKRRGATDSAPADWGNTPDGFWALRNVSLELHEGDFLGIAGHTGSGKSTLIQLANGLLRPAEGRVLVNGVDISDKKAAAEARRNVGVVFQYPEHQLFAATVFEDVAFGPRNLGMPADEVEQAVRNALDMVHLDYDEVHDKSPFALSGGQQRRVAFAGVLAMDPQILILDEPAAGLDPHARESFTRLIEELHAEHGLTVVVVSHSMDDLARLCSSIVVLNRGRIFVQGTPAEVFADEPALHAIGLEVPRAAHIANRLAAAGYALPEAPGGLYSLDTLASAIAEKCVKGTVPFAHFCEKGTVPFSHCGDE